MLRRYPVRRRARQWLAEHVPPRWFLPSRLCQLALGFTARGTTVVDLIKGLQIEYEYGSDIGSKLFRNRRFETREIEFFQELLQRHRGTPVVLDVGANIGLHSMSWAATRADVQVFAFEPSPATAITLERNVARNGLGDRIEIVRAAVSDHEGTAVLLECDDNAYSSLKDTGRKNVIGSVEVPTLTLDQFVERRQIPELALIKVDVEGLETEVLSGAERTLRTLRPDLFVEIYGGTKSNPDPSATVELVRSFGYEALVLIDGHPTPYKRHDDANYNYYFRRQAG